MGRGPYGPTALCLYWDLTAQQRCECVCFRKKKKKRRAGSSNSAHILMQCQGKMPSLTYPFRIIVGIYDTGKERGSKNVGAEGSKSREAKAAGNRDSD